MKRWIRARSSIIIPALPLAALVWMVADGAPPIWLWWASATLAATLLKCNPFGAFDGFLPLPTRTLLLAADVCWMAASMPLEAAAKLAGATVNTLGIRLIVGAVGVALTAVAIRQRPERLEEWKKAVEFEVETAKIMQADEVDRALSQLNAQRNANASHPWNPSQAAKAWSEFGLSQVRALLHQGLDDDHHRTMCTDGLIRVFCYPVWILAWIHALKWIEKIKNDFRKIILEKDEYIDELEEKIDSLRQKLRQSDSEWKMRLNDSDNRAAGFSLAIQSQNKDVSKLKEQLSFERRRVEALEAELEALRSEPEEVPENAPPLEIVQQRPTGAELDNELLRLNTEGFGYGKLAAMYGLSKSGVQKAVGRAKAREQEAV